MRYDDDLCHFLVRIPEFWVLVFGVFGLFPFISLSSFMDESYHDKRITFQSCVFPGRGAQLGLWSWALGAGGRSVGTGSMDWLVGLGWCLMTGTGHDEGKGLLAWVDWVFSDDRGPFGGGSWLALVWAMLWPRLASKVLARPAGWLRDHRRGLLWPDVHVRARTRRRGERRGPVGASGHGRACGRERDGEGGYEPMTFSFLCHLGMREHHGS
jgi:hypothetical protein